MDEPDGSLVEAVVVDMAQRRDGGAENEGNFGVEVEESGYEKREVVHRAGAATTALRIVAAAGRDVVRQTGRSAGELRERGGSCMSREGGGRDCSGEVERALRSC